MELWRTRRVTEAKPTQFFSRFNRQPGFIVAKFCEQADLRIYEPQELRDRDGAGAAAPR